MSNLNEAAIQIQLTQDSQTSPILDDIAENEGAGNLDNEGAGNASITVEDNEVENLFCSKRRKKTSKAWSEFKEVTLKDGTTKAECVHCKYRLAITKGGPTTQFLRHLKSCVRRKLNLKGQQELTISTAIAGKEAVNSVQNFKYDHAKVREITAQMIMVHELPFLLVEYDLFNLMMKTATPHFQSISRATVKKDCFTCYELEKKKVFALLKTANKVSVTTDLWKSNSQKLSYMVVTAHFVDVNCNLQKRILSFCDVPPPHTGVNICDALHKCLIEWEIEDKVWSVTVDNAAYNDVAVRLLKDNLSYKNQLPLCGKLFHVRCCAHILNLLVHDGMSEIGNIIKDVRDSVKHVVKVESHQIVFGEIVKQLKLSSRQLILDCCTRWNATYFMLSAALEFKDVFPRYQQRDPTYYCLPSDEDWAKVQEVCSFLEEFNEITNIISGSEYPTSNLFLYELYNIKKLLDDKYNTEGGFMKAMVEKMKTKFDKYWGECNLLISMGAVMDPRNKMKIIDYCFPLVYSRDDCVKHVATIKESLNKLYNEYLEDYRANSIEVVETRKDCASSTTGKGKNRGREEFYNYIRSVETVSEQIKSELDIYFEEGCHICEDYSSFDVLGWWRMNSLKYKVLSKMACDLLSIPITTVASESTFSAGGRVIDQYRASLGTDTVQVLLCGEDWLRAFYGIKRKRKDKDDIKEYTIPVKTS